MKQYSLIEVLENLRGFGSSEGAFIRKPLLNDIIERLREADELDDDSQAWPLVEFITPTAIEEGARVRVAIGDYDPVKDVSNGRIAEIMHDNGTLTAFASLRHNDGTVSTVEMDTGEVEMDTGDMRQMGIG